MRDMYNQQREPLHRHHLMSAEPGTLLKMFKLIRGDERKMLNPQVLDAKR